MHVRTNRVRLGLAATAALAVGCGNDASTAPPAGPSPPGGAAVASVSIDPGNVTAGAIGATVTLAATVRDTLDKRIADFPVEWSVVRGGVARVDTDGLLTTVGNGTDTVVATAGGRRATAVVDVSQVPAGVRIAAHAQTLSIAGAATTLSASVVDSNAYALSGGEVTWTALSPTVLAVDEDGTATAVSDGNGRVVATYGEFSDTTRVRVDIRGPVGPPISGSLVSCTGGAARGFDCDGIDLLSYLPVAGLGGAPGVRLSDIWGWTDPQTGRDYAIVGRSDGTAFVDVTDPLNPRYRGWLPITTGAAPRIWRDMKIYDDHAFIVADVAGAYGMQVFDLRELRAVSDIPVQFRETVLYEGIASSHNIAVNEQSGFAYVVGANGGGETCGGGLHMIDVRAPDNPRFAGCFADTNTGFARTGYSHDVQCVSYTGPDPDYQGREICLGSNETALSVADVTDKANPVAVAAAAYPNAGYTHQGWITDDHRYFFVNDELDELQGRTSFTRLLVWDITDMDDPVLAREYLGPNRATDHNLYIVGNRLYQSNYQFGIRVLDISDPENPTEVGFFDTAPTAANVPGFGGSWGNYPFFDSGIVVVTSGAEGLFILREAP